MRLIDADALMHEYAKFVRRSNNHDFADVPTWNDAVSLADSAPTIDAASGGAGMRLIDADALYKKTAEWESRAMEMLKKPSLNFNAEWQRWQTILGERTAFKHDVADAPAIDAVPVVRCKDCKHRILNESYDEEKSPASLKAVCDLDTGDPYELGRHAENDEWFCADGEINDGEDNG